MEWSKKQSNQDSKLNKLHESAVIEQEIYSIVSEIEAEKNAFSQLYRFFQEKSSLITDAFVREEELNQEQRIELRHELNDFRARHGLSKREAFYPKSYILHFAWIFVFIFIESLINAYFFGEASSLGLLGGVLIGFITSFFNVALSTMSGYILRFKNHMSKNLKRFGYGVFSLLLIFILFLHLFIAHYREILSIHPHVEIGAVLEPFFNNPFVLNDMESLVLIGLGLIITIFSIFKGLNLDDRYPGYGAIYRRWRVREDAFLSSKQQARTLIRDLHRICLEKSDGLMDKLVELKKRLENISSNKILPPPTEKIWQDALRNVNDKIKELSFKEDKFEKELDELKENYLNSTTIVDILHQVKSSREMEL